MNFDKGKYACRLAFRVFPLVCFCLCSCSKRGDVVGRPDIKSEPVSIAYLKSLYSGYPVSLKRDYVITGTVVSTDIHGNFYKTLVIEDDTGGIEIKIDHEKLFTLFYPGDVVEVRCSSLTLGAYGRVVQLGTSPAGGFETGYISSDDITFHIRKTGNNTDILLGHTLRLDGLSPRYINCLVNFDDVQFVEDGTDNMWCEEGADTDRTLIDREGNTLKVRTSRYASFAYGKLPEGSGSIKGILSYFNDSYQLRVADPVYIDMNGPRFSVPPFGD